MSSEWDGPAELRRSQIESGKDLTFSAVFLPLYRQLVKKLRPASILEVGSGTGHLAAELAELTKAYVGVEPSPKMCAIAREVTQASQVRVHECTLESLQHEEKFDLILSHMCLHAVEDLGGFLHSARKRLSENSVFLFSIPHPAFFNDYKQIFPPDDYSYMRSRSGLIDFKITLDEGRPIQRVPYHHRPISAYFAHLAEVDISISYFHEIFPSSGIQEMYGKPWSTPRYLLLGGGLRPAATGPLGRLTDEQEFD